MYQAECEEVQRNEIEALQSIFVDEFRLRDEEVKTVWQKASVPAFEILVGLHKEDVSQSSPSDALPNITLRVRYSTFYPKTAAKIDLIHPRNLLKMDIDKLKKTIETIAKNHLGSEMIYDLVDILKTQLKTYVQTAQVQSLIDERANRILETRAVQTAREEDQAVVEARLKAEKDAVMQTQIEEELLKKSKSRTYSTNIKQERTKLTPQSLQVTFSRPLSIGSYSFESILLGVPLNIEDRTTTQPWLSYIPEIGQLVVKQYCLHSMNPDVIRSIEAAVARHVKSDVSPDGTVGVENYGSTLQKTEDTKWALYIVQQRASNGSLADLLSTVENVSHLQAKKWLLDLAEELSAAHRHGIIHRYIHASKVLLIQVDGRILARLADWEYSYLIHKQDVYFEASRPALTNQQEPRPSGRRADDIADLGIVFLEMLFGFRVRNAQSIEQFLKDMQPEIDVTLHAFLGTLFARDPRQRLTASDLLTSDYLRLVEFSPSSKELPPKEGTQISSWSRYHMDFEELSKIGQGGYGTVVKARNRLDGRVYAIKKISTMTESRVLREVSGLARLNHPSIVRYFASWVEHVSPSDHGGFESSSESDTSSNFSELDDELEADDFMSSSGIIFAASHSAPTEIAEQSALEPQAMAQRSLPLSTSRMLFIQMEYCSGNTLRTLIDDRHVGQLYWNYFAQIVEGVVYIHGQGLIHRDLKPANIFVSRDGQLKLGDFGLAIESAVEAPSGSSETIFDDERTGDVGTFLYQAPELSLKNPVYDAKVDLYALGIIFGELTCDWDTGMERINILRGLRSAEIILPVSGTQQKEVMILRALLSHDPSARPSAVQLSSMLPPVVHKSYVKDTLKLLEEDPAFKTNVLGNFFSKIPTLVEYTYDAHSRPMSTDYSLVTSKVIDTLTSVFRRHGAIDRSTVATNLFPLNAAYRQKSNVLKLLDLESNVLQLPYDLKVPFARQAARKAQPPGKSYLIAPVFRASDSYHRVLLEADFDIIADSNQAMATFGIETLRVAYEVVQEFPQLHDSLRISLGHSSILQTILLQARVACEEMPRVAAMLHQLAFMPKKLSVSLWKKGLATILSESSIQELLKFMPDPTLDFTDSLNRVTNLLHMRGDSGLSRAVEQLKSLHAMTAAYKIDLPIAFQPFTPNSSMYELSYTVEYGSSELLCIGGDYSRILEQQRLPNQLDTCPAAAGLALAVDKISRIVASRSETTELPRSVDVVVNAYAHESQAIELIARLWDAKISAEVCFEEDVSSFSLERRALFIISFRDKRGTSFSHQTLLRVKNNEKEETEEISAEVIISYLIGEITEVAKRSHRDVSAVPRLVRSASTRKEPEVVIVSTDEHRKMKLPQRQLIANKAVELLQDLTTELNEADVPILVVDFELDQMQQLRSFDPRSQDESVRRIVDKFGAVARAHFLNVKEHVTKLQEEGHAHVFLFSFRCSELLLLNIL